MLLVFISSVRTHFPVLHSPFISVFVFDVTFTPLQFRGNSVAYFLPHFRFTQKKIGPLFLLLSFTSLWLVFLTRFFFSSPLMLPLYYLRFKNPSFHPFSPLSTFACPPCSQILPDLPFFCLLPLSSPFFHNCAHPFFISCFFLPPFSPPTFFLSCLSLVKFSWAYIRWTACIQTH